MASALRRTFRKKRAVSGSYKPNPGSAPGMLTVSPMSHPSQLFVIGYGPEGYVEHACRDVDEINRFMTAWPVVWINVIGLGNIDMIEKVGDLFNIDKILLEDVLDTSHRPKTEYYENHIFTIIKGGTLGDQFESEHISVFLKKNVVIVFEEKPGSSFSSVRERIRRGTGKIRNHGSDYLYYALLDEVIDKYFPILDKLNYQLETIEDEVMAGNRVNDKDVIKQIHHTKSDLLLLHRTIWPISDMINMIIREETPLLTKTVRDYLRDCHDHSMQANELTQFYRDTSSGLLNTFLAYEGHKTNEIVKVLTMISAVFIPLTFVAGVYGMNFKNMPEIASPMGYQLVLSCMFLIVVGMLMFFKRKGWLGGLFAAQQTLSQPQQDTQKPTNGN